MIRVIIFLLIISSFVQAKGNVDNKIKQDALFTQQKDPFIYKSSDGNYCYSEDIEKGCVLISIKLAKKAIKYYVGG